MKKHLKKINEKFGTRNYILMMYGVALVIVNLFIYRFSTDLIILSLVIGAFILGKGVNFLKDWTPPVLLFYLYEQTRAQAAHYGFEFGFKLWDEEIIWLERKLFFFLDDVPPVLIQQWLRPELDVLHWYDYVLFFFYIMFFWYWFATAFILWVKRRDLFNKYFYGLVGFSLFDVFIYFIAPTAPPWWAAQHGFIENIQRILWTSSYLPSDTIQYVHTYGVNDFAAIPSHHTAWPMFATLFLIKAFGKKAYPLLAVPLIIAFATWYGAEHYVVDSIAGAAMAVFTYWFVFNYQNLWDKFRKAFTSKKDYDHNK